MIEEEIILLDLIKQAIALSLNLSMSTEKELKKRFKIICLSITSKTGSTYKENF